VNLITNLKHSLIMRLRKGRVLTPT
jgi:hypothetical protein